MAIDIDPFLGIARQSIPWLMVLADQTENQWDNKAVGIFEKCLNSPSVIAFLRLLCDDPELTLARSPDAPRRLYDEKLPEVADRLATPEIKSAISSLGIGWLEFIQLLPLIIRMLLSVSGKRV